MTPFELAKTSEYLAGMKIKVIAKASIDQAVAGMRAHMMSVVADNDPIVNPPTIFDVVLGRGNLDFDP